MRGPVRKSQPATEPAGDVEAEVARIGAMTSVDLRALWRDTFRAEPPAAFSRDLLARGIAYRVQELAYGGLKPLTARLLRAMAASPGAEPPRQVKVGSVIVREHKGVLHEVMVVPGGFSWRGETYDSLSTIARKITGVNWNGPRFFGLRSKPRADAATSAGATEAGVVASDVNSNVIGASTKTGERGAGGQGDHSASGGGRSGRVGRRSSIRMGAQP